MYTPQATTVMRSLIWSDADKFVINGDGSVSFVTVEAPVDENDTVVYFK